MRRLIRSFSFERPSISRIGAPLLLSFALFACGGGGGGGPAAPLPLEITTVELDDGQVDEAYSQQIDATGGAEPLQYEVSAGELPPGLNLSRNFGAISGTPTAEGTFTFTVTVSSADEQTASAELSIEVDPAEEPPVPITLQPETLPGGEVAIPYSAQLSSPEATAPVVWTVSSGSLPEGLNLDLDNGEISGIPEVGGTYEFFVLVVDGDNRSASAGLTIEIEPAPPLVVEQTVLPFGNRDDEYDEMVVASGGVPPYVWSLVSGDVPDGIVFRPEGRFVGIPTVVGVANLTLRVTDSAPRRETQEFQVSLEIRPPVGELQIDTEFVAEAFVETPYSDVMVASGGLLPYAWTLTGDLPTGVTFDGTTGTLSGTPAEGTGGVYPVTLTVTDTGDVRNPAQSATGDFELSVYTEATRPSLVKAEATDDSDQGRGIQVGDRLILQFTRSTNAPEITPENVGTYIEITGSSASDARTLAGFSSEWTSTSGRDDTLEILFLEVGASDIREGDSISFPIGGIQDRSETFGVVGSPPTIQGSFSHWVEVENSFGVRLRMVPGDETGDEYGFGTSDGRGLFAGDLTGDGKLDLVVVAAPAQFEAPGGSVYVIAGDGGLPLAELNLDSLDQIRARFDGVKSAAVGDYDGDGMMDLAVASRERGVVAIYKGGLDFPTGATQVRDEASGAEGAVFGNGELFFGAQLWFLPNEAGTADDLYVSAPLASPATRTWAGSVYRFDGGGEMARINLADPGGPHYDLRIDLPKSFDGVSEGTAQNSMADGIDIVIGPLLAPGSRDLVIGSTRGQETEPGQVPDFHGAVYVVAEGNRVATGVHDLGAEGAIDNRLYTAVPRARFGHRLDFGDFTADGNPDLVIAAPGNGVQGRDEAGVTYVFRGGQDYPEALDVNQDELWDFRVVGPGRESNAGADVAIGDLNNDGYPDLVIGADTSGQQVGGVGQGEVYVIASGPTGLERSRNLAAPNDLYTRYDGDTRTFIGGEPQAAGLGNAVWAGDLDGDGFDDVLATAGTPVEGGAVYMLGTFRHEGPTLVRVEYLNNTISLIFNRPTNQLAVDAENFPDILVLPEGRSAGSFVSAEWGTTLVSNDTLSLTVDGSQTFELGDLVSIGPSTIRDELNRLNAAGSARIVEPPAN